MNRISLRAIRWTLAFWILAAIPARAYALLAEISSATALSGEGFYQTAQIDTTNKYVYFGSSNPVLVGISTVGYISRFAAAQPITQKPAITFGSLVFDYTASVFDPGTGLSFWASSGTTASIQQVDPFNVIYGSSLTLPAGITALGTGVIDPIHHVAYFGALSSPSVIFKIQLPDGLSITRTSIISSVTLPAGFDYLTASAIDTQNGFAYFGSSTTTGAVTKIKLTDLSTSGTYTFNSGEGGVGSAVIDTVGQIGYFGTHDSPGKIIKVSLTTMSRLGELTLKVGENDLTSAVGDPTNGIAYFGTNTSTGIVVPILLGGPVETNSLTLAPGQNNLRAAVIDLTNQYAYFGTYTSTGIIVEIDLLAGPPTITGQPSSVSAHAGDTVSFFVTARGRSLTYQWLLNGTAISGATTNSYTRLVVAADDGSSISCAVVDPNGTTFSATAVLTVMPVIRVFPDPWRSDLHRGLPMTFDGLAPNSTVKIFNLAAHWVKTLPIATGTTTWDLTNDAGEKVASGYYLYLVTTNDAKQTVHGKLAIIH